MSIVLAGCWLLVAGVRPRPRRTVSLASETGVFLTRRGVSHLVQRCADDVPGVMSASTRVTQSEVVVKVTVTDVDSVGAHVQNAVETRLAALASPPSVRVRAQREGGSV